MSAKESNHSRSAGRPRKESILRGAPKRQPVGAATMQASTSYLNLAAAFPIHPLRSDQELDHAIGVLDKLLSRKKPLDEQEQGYLESLGHEIERYEAANLPMPAVSGAAMLRHLIEARDATLSEVAVATGAVQSVLSGKRELNRRHIERLAPHFGVEPGVFLG